ncbi:MAG: rod-binding protein [Deltaproteobacteria bacterium]|nr:rod-binding protein [Deltaproteobacteria bacterium]MBW2068286.1 rod-binding protein [Deltaproteobacteria bacterium]
MKMQELKLMSDRHKELEIKKDQLRRTCRQFESLFVAYLLKNMKAGMMRSEDPSYQSYMYEAMFDEAVADVVGQSGSFGLGDLLYEQLLPLLEEEAKGEDGNGKKKQ